MKKIIVIFLSIIISNSAFAIGLQPTCAGKKITIYTKPKCSYCIGLRSILDKLEIKYTNIDLTKNRTIVNWLISTTNANTVPYVFLDETYIGGYTDFVNLCLKPIAQSNRTKAILHDLVLRAYEVYASRGLDTEIAFVQSFDAIGI